MKNKYELPEEVQKYMDGVVLDTPWPPTYKGPLQVGEKVIIPTNNGPKIITITEEIKKLRDIKLGLNKEKSSD